MKGIVAPSFWTHTHTHTHTHTSEKSWQASPRLFHSTQSIHHDTPLRLWSLCQDGSWPPANLNSSNIWFLSSVSFKKREMMSYKWLTITFVVNTYTKKMSQNLKHEQLNWKVLEDNSKILTDSPARMSNLKPESKAARKRTYKTREPPRILTH